MNRCKHPIVLIILTIYIVINRLFIKTAVDIFFIFFRL
ncbi:hypothetical protein M2480_001989 [Parabacteroides sp. PFB2-12]|nr:hypothetical protein [Parabacteroides sp. PM6-13]MDH6391000.1 hypothetical protein [Parabacteroides sp. PFB2-12]